jgi:hypothetical protein
LFVRDILCRRIEAAYFADLLRFESNPYPRRRNARLMDLMKVDMFFAVASVALCLESGLIYCDCKNISSRTIESFVKLSKCFKNSEN